VSLNNIPRHKLRPVRDGRNSKSVPLKSNSQSSFPSNGQTAPTETPQDRCLASSPVLHVADQRQGIHECSDTLHGDIVAEHTPGLLALSRAENVR
jgi:hypothetical protein